MKKVIISVVVIILALVGIFYVLQNNKAKSEALTAIVAQKNTNVTVQIDTVSYKTVGSDYQVNGIFTPGQEVKISAETAGRVTKVLVEEGAHVRSGQILAVIESDRQDVNVTNAKAVYQNAQSEVQRFQSAYATGGVTKQQLDQVKLQLENAKSNLKSAQIAAADVNVRASFAGIVNSKTVEQGAYVSPGTELFDIVDVTPLKLKVHVDEKNIGNIKLGQKIKVTASTLPQKSWEGKVSFIAPKANNNLSFPVELKVENIDDALRAGMYGVAYFGGENSERRLIVPRTAFVGSVSSNKVFVVKNKKAVLTDVLSGNVFGEEVEIISGLEKGDKVVVSGQINLLDNTPVQIIK